jgi:hypothetical protein
MTTEDLLVAPLIFDDVMVSKELIAKIPTDTEVRTKGERIFKSILSLSSPELVTFKLVKGWINEQFPRKISNEGDSVKAQEYASEMISLIHVMALKHMIYLKFCRGEGFEFSLENFPLPSVKDDDILHDQPDERRRSALFYRAIKIAHGHYGMPASAQRDHLMAIGTKFESAVLPAKFYPGGGKRTKSRILRDNLIDLVTNKKRHERDRPKGIKKRNANLVSNSSTDISSCDSSCSGDSIGLNGMQSLSLGIFSGPFFEQNTSLLPANAVTSAPEYAVSVPLEPMDNQNATAVVSPITVVCASHDNTYDFSHFLESSGSSETSNCLPAPAKSNEEQNTPVLPAIALCPSHDSIEDWCLEDELLMSVEDNSCSDEDVYLEKDFCLDDNLLDGLMETDDLLFGIDFFDPRSQSLCPQFEMVFNTTMNNGL